MAWSVTSSINKEFLYIFSIYILDLPENVEDYHDIYPLDIYGHSSKILTYSTSTYRATYSKTGEKCCLKRIHGNNLMNYSLLLLVIYLFYVLLQCNLQTFVF